MRYGFAGQVAKRFHMGSFIAVLLVVAMFASLGCSMGEEPRYKNMPISVYLKRVVKSNNEKLINESMTNIIAVGKPGVPYVLKAWKKYDDDIKILHNLCIILHDIGPDAEAAIPLLSEALNGYEEELISYSAFAIAGIGKVDAPTVERLGKLLRSSDTTTQIHLLMALGAAKEGAKDQIPLILAALEREGTRNAAVEALSKIGKPAIDAVKPWLESGTKGQRLAALRVLAGSGEGVGSVLPNLAIALDDKDPQIREQAINAIGQAGIEALVVEEKVIAALNDKNRHVRTAAINALKKMGTADREKLINALNSRKARIREGAALAIGSYENLCRESQSKLVRHMGDSSVDVRLAVIDALTIIGPDIVPVMMRQLDSDMISRRHAAANVLGNLGSAAEAALPKLEKLTRDKDSIVREEAMKAIKKIKK